MSSVMPFGLPEASHKDVDLARIVNAWPTKRPPKERDPAWVDLEGYKKYVAEATATFGATYRCEGKPASLKATASSVGWSDV